MRAKGSMEWDIMVVQGAGYRRQGKPWMCWLDIIKEATGLRLEVLKETGQEKKVHDWWRKRLGIGNAQM